MLKPLFALAAMLASTAAADTLIDNVNGMQVDARGNISKFGGLVVSDDGRVVRVLAADEEAQPANITRHIDMQGRTMLPGLIDAHGHVIDSTGGDMGLGLLMLRLDLSGAGSIAEVQDRLRRYAADNPGGGWILGRGWNQELWPDKSFPTAADIDSVIADRPVFLTRVDGHAAVANSAAMKAAGLTFATLDLDGGRIERTSSGQPTGLLIDNAMSLIASKVPATSAETMDRALQAAQESLLSTGLTTVADMGTSPAGWGAMRRFGETNRLKIRVISYSDGMGPLPPDTSGRPTEWHYGDRLRMVGIKLYGDGALGSRGAWLKRAYADSPGAIGAPVTGPKQLREQGGRAAQAGFQLVIHAIGDRANAEAISVFEDLAGKYPGDRRWRIEHVQIVDPADIPRIAKAGIIASMQPVHQTSDRLMAEIRLDPPRLEGAYAWQTLARTGARLALGSDFPVESPNPFPGLAAAISRQDMAGQPPGGWYPDERMTFAQALDGFTRGAAFAGFAEDRIGSLEPGKWADFIIIDRDPTKIDAQALARTQVLETWVAGKKVWAKSPNGGPGERGR